MAVQIACPHVKDGCRETNTRAKWHKRKKACFALLSEREVFAMRHLRLTLTVLVSLFVLATLGPAQNPFGRGGRGMGGMGRNIAMGPDAFFNSISGGKDVVSRAEITNPWMQTMFDRMVSQ